MKRDRQRDSSFEWKDSSEGRFSRDQNAVLWQAGGKALRKREPVQKAKGFYKLKLQSSVDEKLKLKGKWNWGEVGVKRTSAKRWIRKGPNDLNV